VAQARVVASSGVLGRLWKKGMRRVRMRKMTSVCVASESTNQPESEERRASVEAVDHDGEGEELVDRADRPERQHEAADEADVPL